MPKRNPRSLGEMQVDANEYARQAFAKTPFHLHADGFEKSADAIIAALVQAWAAGYAARNEERAR